MSGMVRSRNMTSTAPGTIGARASMLLEACVISMSQSRQGLDQLFRAMGESSTTRTDTAIAFLRVYLSSQRVLRSCDFTEVA